MRRTLADVVEKIFRRRHAKSAAMMRLNGPRSTNGSEQERWLCVFAPRGSIRRL
jgi:hypothetical protein